MWAGSQGSGGVFMEFLLLLGDKKWRRDVL